MSPTASSTPPADKNRGKRVLPSRARRGGPGIGNCDVDIMILESRKRQYENEPLVPASTSFLLTTDASLLTGGTGPEKTLGINTKANSRYFERPEVLKAYKEQEEIQTPEFESLSEDASVGGRFRPRELEDKQEANDTSDAVYEKRHRKYEAFEKRLRLREKEKLKHEHYKLKERIEQLRGMDGSAFLVLPASSFSPPVACGSTEDASAKANGTSSHNEGERRRQEMLEVASLLEGKYRTLLPGDRKLADKATADSRDSAEPPDSADGESEVEEPDDQEEPPNQSLQEKLKLKIKLPRGGLPRKKGTKGQAASPSAPRKSRATSSPLAQEANGTVDDVEQGTRKRKKPTSVDEDDSIFPSPANPTVDSMGKTSCVLLQSAMRSASAPQVRKTQQRNVTAFGTKLPPQLDAVRHFELPWWIIRHRDIPDGGEVGAGADVALGSSSLQEEPVQNE